MKVQIPMDEHEKPPCHGRHYVTIKRSHKGRLVFMSALGAGLPDPHANGVADAIAEVLVWDASTDTARLAGQMLGLAPSDTNRQPGGYVDWSGLVRAFAGVDREQLHTAAEQARLDREQARLDREQDDDEGDDEVATRVACMG